MRDRGAVITVCACSAVEIVHIGSTFWLWSTILAKGCDLKREVYILGHTQPCACTLRRTVNLGTITSSAKLSSASCERGSPPSSSLGKGLELATEI